MNPFQKKMTGAIAGRMTKDDVGEPNAENAQAVTKGATQSGWMPDKWKANLSNAFSPAPEPEAAPAAKPLTEWQKQVMDARARASASRK